MFFQLLNWLGDALKVLVVASLVAEVFNKKQKAKYTLLLAIIVLGLL